MAQAAARRHAQAAFEIALEQNGLDVWRRDLSRFSEVVKDPDLSAFLESPRVHFEDKAKVLRQGLEDLNPLVMNLALLLIARGRLGLVADMVLEYGRLVDEHGGIAHAEVVTAVSLEPKEKDKLIRRLGELVGREIVLITKVDPAIIGGLIARVGDKLIDGSTKSRLLSLKGSLMR
jgi:F-type H+-transporting ATPase subunit delta